MPSGNSNGNKPPPYEPAAGEPERMKAEYRLSWHPRGGWCRVFPGDRDRTYFGRIPPADAVRAMLAEERRRATGEATADSAGTLRLRHAVNLFLAHADKEHALGKRKAARLMQVVVEADIGWEVVRTWAGGREFERRLKKQHNHKRLCPVCRAWRAPNGILSPFPHS